MNLYVVVVGKLLYFLYLPLFIFYFKYLCYLYHPHKNFKRGELMNIYNIIEYN